MTDSTKSTLPDKTIRELREAVTPERVILDPAVLKEVSEDLTEVARGRAEVVVRPRTVEEVRRVLQTASRSKVAVVPMVANTNVGGLAIPDHGGIVLDLREMNRILEVNEQDMYMVVEPGVTWQDVSDRLGRDHPSFRIGYSLAPPDSSILCNCLLDGLTTLGLKHGPTGDWINGIEAVLADGQVIKTGAMAMGGTWCSDSPAPDLTGLFINMQGTTGIVTKMAIQIFPKPAFGSRGFILAYEIEAATRLIRRLVREDICDDIGGLTWPIVKMLFGEQRPTYRDPDEPIFFVYSDISAPREETYRAKMSALEAVLAEERGTGAHLVGPLDIWDIVPIEPGFRKLAEFPTRLDFLLDRGGLTWIGTYGPISRWEEGLQKGIEVMERRGFPPLVVTRPMRGGHFGVLRFISTFDKEDADEVTAVRDLNVELSDVSIDLGFIPYKTPPWLIRRHKDRIDPGFLALLKKIRSVMDPDGILNPGKWSP
ncbi:MAG: FAD-binding oxidoreductase [Planctomycetota bacterium]|nr:FAD-binding oxidoreductase [Planctomycetota bacterium]